MVGYQKLTIQPGLNLIGTGFLEVGTKTEYALKDLFHGTDVASAKAGGDMLEGDLIQLFDAAANKKGYFTQYYFYTSGGVDGPDYDDKWYDVTNEEEPTEEAIIATDGFWYNYRGTSAITLTTAGEVSPDNVEITIQPGLNLITYPFPADFDFTSLDWVAAGATAGGDMIEGDLIQLFDAAPDKKGYFTQYYFYTSGGVDGPDYDNKWYDVTNEEEPTTAKIPAASGFWYNHKGSTAFTITFPSPLAD